MPIEGDPENVSPDQFKLFRVKYTEISVYILSTSTHSVHPAPGIQFSVCYICVRGVPHDSRPDTVYTVCSLRVSHAVMSDEDAESMKTYQKLK